MKTILITGANGYIGRHVVAALKDFDARIIAVDRNIASDDNEVEFIECDIFDPSFDVESLAGSVDACLHLAWRDGFIHNSPSHMLDLSSHYRFIEKLIEKEVPQIATMGSMHEVGYWEGYITEETPCNPQSLYGIAKDALRRAVFLKAKDTDSKIQWLRGFYIFGDDENSQSIFGKLYRASKSGDSSFPFTSGKNKYDFLHINDLAFQIASCVMQDEISGVINCCSGQAISIGEQVEAFIAENHLNITLDYGAYPDRPYDSPAIWGDNSTISSILKVSDGQTQ